MNMNYGGIGGNILWDKVLTSDDFGDEEAFLCSFKEIQKWKKPWFIEKLSPHYWYKFGQIDCHVCVGDTQFMSFVGKKTPPLFNFSDDPYKTNPK